MKDQVGLTGYHRGRPTRRRSFPRRGTAVTAMPPISVPGTAGVSVIAP